MNLTVCVCVCVCVYWWLNTADPDVLKWVMGTPPPTHWGLWEGRHVVLCVCLQMGLGHWGSALITLRLVWGILGSSSCGLPHTTHQRLPQPILFLNHYFTLFFSFKPRLCFPDTDLKFSHFYSMKIPGWIKSSFKSLFPILKAHDVAASLRTTWGQQMLLWREVRQNIRVRFLLQSSKLKVSTGMSSEERTALERSINEAKTQLFGVYNNLIHIK